MSSFFTSILSSPVSFPLAPVQGSLALSVSQQPETAWNVDLPPTTNFFVLDDHELKGIRQDAGLISMLTGEPVDAIAARLARSPLSNPNCMREVPADAITPLPVECAGVVREWGVSDRLASFVDLFQPDHEEGTPGERQRNLLYLGRSIIFSDGFKRELQSHSDDDVRTYYQIANRLSFLRCLPKVIPNLRLLLEMAPIPLKLKKALCKFIVDMAKGCTLPEQTVVQELLYIIHTIISSRYFNEHDLYELLSYRKHSDATFKRIRFVFERNFKKIDYTKKAFSKGIATRIETIFQSPKIPFSVKKIILRKLDVTGNDLRWNHPPLFTDEHVILIRCIATMAAPRGRYTGRDIQSCYRTYQKNRERGLSKAKAVGAIVRSMQEFSHLSNQATKLLAADLPQREALLEVIQTDQIDYLFKTEILRRVLQETKGKGCLHPQAAEIIDFFRFSIRRVGFSSDATVCVFSQVDHALQSGEGFDGLKSDFQFLSFFQDNNGYLNTDKLNQYYRFLERPFIVRATLPGPRLSIRPARLSKEQAQALFLLETAFGSINSASRIGKILYNLRLYNRKRPSLEKKFLVSRILESIYNYVFRIEELESLKAVRQDDFLKHYFDKKMYEKAEGKLDIDDSFVAIRDNRDPRIHITFRGFCYEFIAKVWALEHLPHYDPFPDRKYWTEAAGRPFGYYIVDPDGTYMPTIPAQTLSAFEAKAVIAPKSNTVLLEDYLLLECRVRSKTLTSGVAAFRRGNIMSQFLRVAMMMCDPAHAQTHYHLHFTSTKPIKALESVKSIFRICLELEAQRAPMHGNSFANRSTGWFMPTPDQIDDIMRRLEISYEYVDPAKIWGVEEVATQEPPLS